MTDESIDPEGLEAVRARLLRMAELSVLIQNSQYIPIQPTTKQMMFCLDERREVFYGGQLGGGKSVAQLAAALMHVDKPGYYAVLIRRTYADLSKPGALMHMADEWLYGTDAKRKEKGKEWHFPSGAKLVFGYMENDTDKLQYQGCCPSDTEVLTENGWKAINEVKVGERVASIDPKTRQATYKAVTQTHAYAYTGEMLELDGKSINFCVTPNHRVLYSTQRVSELRFAEADKLPRTARFPQVAEWADCEDSDWLEIELRGNPGGLGAEVRTVRTGDYLELMGWTIAEASRNAGFSFSLKQLKSHSCAEIEALLTRMGIRYAYRAGAFHFSCKTLALELGHVLSYDKTVPRRWFSDTVSVTHKKRLLDALVSGDGHRYNETYWTFRSTSKALADDVQELALMCGWRATSSQISCELGPVEICGQQTNRNYAPYAVWLTQPATDTWPNAESWRRIPNPDPNGMVYCLSVQDNENFFMRRNGRVCFTGNSNWSYVGYDEASQFTPSQLKYLFSRLRQDKKTSALGIPLRYRLTSNPGHTSHEYLRDTYVRPRVPDPNKLYIPAGMADNPYLEAEEYREMLQNLDVIERAQLVEGDWFVTPEGGFFKNNLPVVPQHQSDADWSNPKVMRVRAWDLAASEDADGDFAVGMLVAYDPVTRKYRIEHVARDKANPAKIEALLVKTKERDAGLIPQLIEQERGSAGKMVLRDLRTRVLQGAPVYAVLPSGDKLARARLGATLVDAGDVELAPATWNEALLLEFVGFPEMRHDDQVDAFSHAVHWIAKQTGGTRVVSAARASISHSTASQTQTTSEMTPRRGGLRIIRTTQSPGPLDRRYGG